MTSIIVTVIGFLAVLLALRVINLFWQGHLERKAAFQILDNPPELYPTSKFDRIAICVNCYAVIQRDDSGIWHHSYPRNHTATPGRYQR